MDKEWVTRFMEYLVSRNALNTDRKKMTKSTVFLYLCYVRAALNYAVRESVIPKSPFKGITRVPNDSNDKVLVCLDAGIATEENLRRIKDNGYNYLCVSRRRLSDYELTPDTKTVTVIDSKQQPISLTQVRHEEGSDYYLEIKSPPPSHSRRPP